jgi:hypothetical protein
VIVKKMMIIFIICSLFLLAGCLNRQTTAEKMHEMMEHVVQAEEVFELQQEPLAETEKEEKEVYDKIIALGMKKYDQIVQLAEEALLLVEQRKTLMVTETESIVESKKQFEKLLPLVEELNEPDLKKEAQGLYSIMMERYSIHDELQKEYLKALELDKELYQFFMLKDLSMEKLESQINSINEIYTNIYSINERFNQQTEKYNELKLKFYQNAGFNVGEKDKE